MPNPTLTCVLALLLPSFLHAQPSHLLLENPTAAQGQKFVLNDCQVTVVRTKAGTALRLAYGHKSPWPSFRCTRETLGFPADWSRFAALALTVSNPNDKPVKLGVRVDSAADKARGRQAVVEVAPNVRTRLLMPSGGSSSIIGMRGQPPLAVGLQGSDELLQPSGVPFDAKDVTNFQLFMPQPKEDHALLLHRIELLPGREAKAAPFVDRFGQYNGADWLGKLHTESEFADRLRAEEADLAARPSFPDRDQYGGWKEGPQLEATGRFRVQKHAGKWWFVDPKGRLFWSSGITCVRVNGQTVVTGREHCYEWLPQEDDPLASCYSGWSKRRLFDFFRANLQRKYGQDHLQRFYELATRRLPSWGFNTLACWSAPDVWRLHKVPYTLSINVPKVPMFVATSHLKAGLEKKKWFPDPFAPQFRQGLEKQLAAHAEFKDDPFCLGAFIHNELPWVLGAPWRGGGGTGIGLLCLQQNDSTFVAKQELLKWLRAKYPRVDQLNRAWGSDFASWEALGGLFKLTEAQRKKARPDLLELDKLIAEQYFRVCREAMNKKLPGVLYLGCRFSGMYDRHFVEIAKRYCDVVSFNIYEYLPSQRTADELATELDFPVVIGEYHFGALDRGMFDPGLRRAKDQTDRAAKFAAYNREALAAPWCVGAHWFQYLDQPLTGRTDGENYNIGFVDATDDPYPELVAAAREVYGPLYRARAGNP